MSNFEKESVLSNVTVLYIEDESFAREELFRFLKRRVGRIVSASNGLEGVELIEKYNPDIVVTDLNMPGMSGLEMIKEVRANGFKGGIIIISALSDSETILEAVNMGAVKYIVKPVDTAKLIEFIREMAAEIIKEKTGNVVLSHKFVLNKEEKREVEDRIKSKTASFIKKFTGKGPKNVRVFIQGEYINIDVEEVLTIFEQSILISNKNHSLVEYNRKIFYLENKEELESTIGDAIGSSVSLVDIESNSKKNVDFIKFSFQ